MCVFGSAEVWGNALAAELEPDATLRLQVYVCDRAGASNTDTHIYVYTEEYLKDGRF